MKIYTALMSLIFCFCSEAVELNSRGFWVGTENIEREHCFDPYLAKALALFFQMEEAQNVVDFGCGMGQYVSVLRDHHIACDGYDGNPDTPLLTKGIAQVLDLSQPFDLNMKYDWVLSLEVGEHIPREYESIFIENLDRHNVRGIILSWAVEGQGGFGHFNCRNNDYIKEVMKKYGYMNDVVAEEKLRYWSSLMWFKNTIMVFRKIN